MTSVAGLALLIVEDDEDSRELLEMFLTSQGACVRAVGCAADARAAIREQAPDVLLADLTLPDESGFELIGALRAEPATRHIPAIAMTGHTDAAARQQAIAAGFHALVTKPLDIWSLVAAVASLAATTQKPA